MRVYWEMRMKGDATLFARADGAEAAWRVVQPILDIPM